MIQEQVHGKIVDNCEKVQTWFKTKREGLALPIYSSFDIRDSGFKVVPVDANFFPAGFNNICHVDKEHAPEVMREYLESHYPNLGKRVGLLAEEHTNNAYYWENVLTLKSLLEASGREAVIALPRPLTEPIRLKSSSGREAEVHGASNLNGDIFIKGEKVDLIVCNNDFSEGYQEWSRDLRTPMNPPHELGWYRRRKNSFFQKYNQLASEFADHIGIDPFVLRVETETFTGFDADDPDRLEALANQVDAFLARLKEKYVQHGISTEPFCFLKNNMGTYGLAVIQAHSGEEVRKWNNKARKKMKAAKGGRTVDELIIQEGVPTRFRDDSGGGSAEPCIYLIGGELVGGFLRTHSEKGPDESLNSPGAIYKRLCMSDLEVDMPGCPMENVYGWISKLSVLAMASEAKEARVEFKDYKI